MSNQIIKFGAGWCGPCRAMKPHFEKFRGMVEGKEVEVLDVDVDEQSELASQYGVRSIPFTVFVKDGEVKKKATGLLTAEALLSSYNEIYS
jgi:thioredoxin 1